MAARRVFLIVLDGLGVGALPDAASFGDTGSNTLLHAAEAVGRLHVPNLARLGLGNIQSAPGLAPVMPSVGSWGRMREAAAGKDTMVGHWELLGVIAQQPLPTYPRGFPPEVLEGLRQRWNRGIIGNRPASGTRIIEELGEEHLRTGALIVYTSADSVLQVAAHEAVVAPEQLYEYCRQAREEMVGKHAVGRVIARPFVGRSGAFQRTAGRRDFSLPPPGPTVLDLAEGSSVRTVAVGKVADILAHRGFNEEVAAAGNDAVAWQVIRLAREIEGPALVLANLTDFDTLYGHRNDAVGLVSALERFDTQLGELLGALRRLDLLVLTADHGCDPTTPSTDHSREYVPLLVVAGERENGQALGERETFADLGATVADALGIEAPPAGTSFWESIVYD